MKSLLSTFASTPTEVHALGYGCAAGFIAGLTYGTKAQSLGIGVLGSIVGAALGLKKLNRMGNSSVVTELHKEPQYALAALVVGFIIAAVVRLLYRIGIVV